MTQKQPNNNVEMSDACLLWFRFDLRLNDHEGVTAAVGTGLPIIPVYIYDENLGTRPLGAASKWWLHRSLKALDKSLHGYGSRLTICKGSAHVELKKLCKKYNVKTIVCSNSFDPKLEKQDDELASSLKQSGIILNRFNTGLLSAPNEVRTKTGEAFRVFTPFYRAMVAEGLCLPKILPNLKGRWRAPDFWPISDTIDALGLNDTVTVSGMNWAQGFDIWTPGEIGARNKLDQFIDNGLRLYADYRDRPDIEATSKLSPHLRFGEISPHRILYELDQAHFHQPALQKNIEKFRSELVWREFSYGLLAQKPRLDQVNFRSGYDGVKWQNDPSDFKAWKTGMTGYSLVDAGMRELWQTGFMHNRVRMVAASFLIKHLLIDWRRGEDWFWECLVDADPANNPASWQWVAGSGADAAPYFRIFNPITQGDNFDPKGMYRSKYIQGYTLASTKITPRKTSLDMFDIPKEFEKHSHYPQPIIDHGFARERALAAFGDRHNEI